MSEREQDHTEVPSEEAAPYEKPVVEDIEAVDGPAVTAAGKTKVG